MKKKKTALCNSNRSRKTRRHFSKKVSYGKRAAVLSNSSMYTFKEVLFLWQEHNKLSHKGATEAKYNYLIQKHSDVGITLRTYVHPSMELKRTQIEKLAKE